MSTPHPREAGLEALLRQQRSDVAPGDACLDAETLAAWAEGGLDDRARATAEAHAAGCARCQALVATIVRTEPEPTPAVGPSLWDRLGFRWLVPLTAAAAAVLLWIAVPPSAPDRPADTLAVSQPAPEANAAANRDRAAAPAGGAASGAAQPPAAPTAGTGAVGQRLTGPGAATAPGGGSSPAAQAKAAPAEALRVEPAAHPAALRQPAPERRLDAPADRASARNEAVAPDTRQREAKLDAPAEAGKRQDTAKPSAPVSLDALNELASLEARAAAEPSPPPPAAPPPPPAGGTSALGRAVSASGAVVANREPPRIVSDDAAVQWRLAEPGVVERSLDGGTTWTRTQTGVAVEPTAGAAPSSTVCWLVGRGGLVLRTTDARTWQRVAAPVNEDLIAVEAVDAQSATVRTAGGARYRTTDGGTTWSRVP